MRPALLALAAATFAGAALAAATAQAAPPAIERTYASPTAFLASSVVVPAGADTVYLSGVLPAPETFKGDTEAQANSVLDRIGEQLKGMGLGFGDVVLMHVYLAGDPAKGGALDFAGWQAAYLKRFGTATQPNRPARSAFQVAHLANPDALLEVEVTAARPHR